jgi:hypothetical protein
VTDRPHEFPNFERRPDPAVIVVVAAEIEIAKLFTSVLINEKLGIKVTLT